MIDAICQGLLRGDLREKPVKILPGSVQLELMVFWGTLGPLLDIFGRLLVNDDLGKISRILSECVA